MGEIAMRKTLIQTLAAAMLLALTTAAGAAPRDSRRFIPPNTPGQAGHVDLKLNTDPPGLVGPGVKLVVQDGVLSGEVQGHAVSVNVGGTHAEGTGPSGKVSVDWSRGADGTLAMRGVWNDHKVNLDFKPRGITGRLMQSVTPTGDGVKSCRFDINQTKGPNVSGLSECLGYSEPVRYSIQPTANADLNSPEVALMLVAFFESPTSFAVR
jgi:hypothetical protein